MEREKKDKKEYNFQTLTPINNAKLHIYDDALNFVFENNDIRNVAISGPYSAGKSSVIESYKLKSSDKRFLHISLAHFSETTSESVEGGNTTDKAILEGKILNQLIHQIKQNKIPQTKFKIKQKAEPKKIIFSTMIFITFLILVYYINSFNKWSSFVPTLKAEWLKSTLMWTTSNITLLFSGLACFVILGIATYFIITFQKNKNILKRLKLQGNEIEIFEEKDDSFFDKYLNEVLYLFEHSNADAIVFEDMDRFNANKIFEKLREINTLVNNKKAEEDRPPIRFLYLLKDDIFTSKDRTKFFDFILPIVPVIDGSNSYDQLIGHLNEGKILDLFVENFLNELSLYIDDMRILKNIYNEFIIYHNRILFKEDESQTEQENKELSDSTLINLDNNKLLGIIVYKNLFPKDFSDLHLRTGFVYTLFENKPLFIEQEIEKIDHKIGEIKEKIQLSEDEIIESINELDAIYLLGNYQIVRIAGLGVTQFKTRVQLVKAIKDNPDQVTFTTQSRYEQHLDVTSELNKIRQGQEYIERKKAIDRKTENQIEKLKVEHQRLIKQKNTVQNSKLSKFICKDNIDTIFSVTYTNEIGEQNKFEEIKGSNYFPLIKYLVRYGYIDENYSDYMTYFYENSLSRIDKNFLLSVTDQIPKDYSYSLNDPKKVISRLTLGHFDHVEILNFDLLKHLLLTKSNNDKYLISFLHQLKDTTNFHFIFGFLELGRKRETKLFIKEINNMWPNIFHSVQDEGDFSYDQKKQYSVYSLYYSPDAAIENLNKSNCLTDFIANSDDFLDIESPDIEKLIAGFSLLGVKFEWINYAEANNRVFQEVYQNNLYKLTFDLICLMLERVYGLDKSDDFKNKNYTLVISKQDEPLTQYVNRNFNHYIKEILENCDELITDAESVALSIINHTEIDPEDKNMYISYLKTSIQLIDNVNDTDIWALLLQEQIVEYSENNILNYFFHQELDLCLIDFINESDRLLEFESSTIDTKFGEESATKFFMALVNNNELTNERYESILKTFERHFKTFSNTEIDEDKIKILIKIDIMYMTEENLIFMRENYSSLLLCFIKHNIRQYTEVVINEDNFEMDELLSVLNENVEDKYKISLLEFSSDVITLKEKDYSDPVKLHILEHNFNLEDIPYLLDRYTNERSNTISKSIKTISIQHVEEIISAGYSVPFELLTELFLSDQLEMETKMELFAQCLPDMSEKHVIKSLRTLQMADYISLFERKRPTFEINKVNETILDDFKKRKWITDFDTDENNAELFRAIGRNRPDILALI
ncbi:YobI family P-loop NTPase [Jeotgalibacillus campisalis]|uniref:YobI-like P-loop NTPase domain-containing protein n=1 Tax=Jeotgalibacillus campisalis TaxID=220754 RepID=A0A0C2QXY8_9BACL|nr:hypothetical protein [Jeotgalibacillus campisalis]KIL42910.1 hypothetical protein KR50_33130 [Jeotgalibacillus campisalis]